MHFVNIILVEFKFQLMIWVWQIGLEETRLFEAWM